MFAILKQPFPAHTLPGSIRMAAVIGLFVAVFLLVFQPFGMREAAGGLPKILAISGYGLVTFGCISLLALTLPALFPGWFRPQTWTVGKEIQITLLNFLVIGFFNTLYTFLIFRQPFNVSYLLYFQLITLAVGILPVSLLVLFRHNRLLQTNLKLAHDMNSELNQTFRQRTGPADLAGLAGKPTQPGTAVFIFASETGNEKLVVKEADFLFAVAADNYVELHFLANGLPKKSLIRSSLSRAEETTKAASRVVRCHRAYLVNLAWVSNFSGNAQGLKLELSYTSELIPVSRKMVPGIKALLPG